MRILERMLGIALEKRRKNAARALKRTLDAYRRWLDASGDMAA